MIENEPSNGFQALLKMRHSLLINDTELLWRSIGAKTKRDKNHIKRVSRITKSICSRPVELKWLHNYHRIYKPKISLELGTCIGLSTAVMAKSNPNGQYLSIEGQQSLVDFARILVDDQNLPNIQIMHGMFHEVLPELLDRTQELDFVYIDGHHDGEATLEYFNLISKKLSKNAIVIFDDIYWSKNMKAFWKDFTDKRQFGACVDLYHWGVYFHSRNLVQAKNITLIAKKYKPWSTVL